MTTLFTGVTGYTHRLSFIQVERQLELMLTSASNAIVLLWLKTRVAKTTAHASATEKELSERNPQISPSDASLFRDYLYTGTHFSANLRNLGAFFP